MIIFTVLLKKSSKLFYSYFIHLTWQHVWEFSHLNLQSRITAPPVQPGVLLPTPVRQDLTQRRGVSQESGNAGVWLGPAPSRCFKTPLCHPQVNTDPICRHTSVSPLAFKRLPSVKPELTTHSPLLPSSPAGKHGLAGGCLREGVGIQPVRIRDDWDFFSKLTLNLIESKEKKKKRGGVFTYSSF